jgi:hypothetical protein
MANQVDARDVNAIFLAFAELVVALAESGSIEIRRARHIAGIAGSNQSLAGAGSYARHINERLNSLEAQQRQQ